jgi:hypothetical protein
VGSPHRTGLAKQVVALELDPRDGSVWFLGKNDVLGKIKVTAPCSSGAAGAAGASSVTWSPRRPFPSTGVCVDPKHDPNLLPPPVVHDPGYMNTQIPETYGVNKSCAELNLDAILMAAHTCHRCLPEPCKNNGTCTGKQGHGFSCDCPSGFGGDLCQSSMSLIGGGAAKDARLAAATRSSEVAWSSTAVALVAGVAVAAYIFHDVAETRMEVAAYT